MKKAIVLGAGGFIGNNLVNRLKGEGYYVDAIDLKRPEFQKSVADDFYICDAAMEDYHYLNGYRYDEIYQLAADMGGAGYIFTGDNDSQIMDNNVRINLNLLRMLVITEFKGKVFFSSSACIYPEYNQRDPKNPKCDEISAYPAAPDSEYGWEKLFSERLYQTYARNYGLNVRIARFHNVYGPMGTYKGGREKSIAAICRKVAEAKDGDSIEVWGTGEQTRSFIYIDDCLDGVRKLMDSEFPGPVNIGSEDMLSINDLALKIIKISGKNIFLKHVDGPIGVNGRNSDNRLCLETLKWEPKISLDEGLKKTYEWIVEQMNA